MKSNRRQYIWGVLVIIVGVFFLVDNLGLLPEFGESAWAFILAGAALLFLMAWLLTGVDNWPLLFPAVGTAAGAMAIWLEQVGAASELIGSLVLILVSVPFWAGVVVKREPVLAVPGWVLLAIGVLLLFERQLDGELFGALILFAVALPFLAIFLVNRKNWWALLPFLVMAASGVAVLFSEVWRSEYVGALVMFAIAVPFLALYLRNRQQWWPLIPAYVMGVIGVIILLSMNMRGEIVGSVVLFAIGLPFLVIYLLDQKQWWALIPGGVMLTIGLITLLSMGDLSGDLAGRLVGGLFFAGPALVFFLVWNKHHEETRWAVYPAAILAAAALLVIGLGPSFEIVLPVLLIAAGILLLFRTGRALPKP